MIDVSRGRNQRTPTDWRSTLRVTLACVAWWSVVPSARAQKSVSPTVMASLSISTIQPEFFLTSVSEQTNYQALRSIKPVGSRLIKPHRA